MPKVWNLTKKGVPLLRWRVLPDNRVLDPQGRIHDQLPDDVGYSAQAKRLCELGVLNIEGVSWFPEPEKAKKAPPAPEDPGMPEMPRVDDLTELVHIGKGRAKKLEVVGVVTFADVVEMGARDLDRLLEITRDMAEEIVADAEGKVEP
jgi:hypothetical protein